MSLSFGIVCKRIAYVVLLVVCTGIAAAQGNQPSSQEETQFSVYGFGRMTMVWDDQDMKRSDLFVPANIQVGATKSPNIFMGAKQTRLGFDVKHRFGEETLNIKLEGDFHNDASDATGIFRMRLAYAEYKFVLVGMNWSNFFDADANPITVDFEGPNSSTLARAPQVRFSTFRKKNVFSLSLENPIENVSLGGGVIALPERFPDVIAAYRFNSSFGFVKTAALFREIRYESDRARSLPGYGLTVLGAISTGSRDKLRFQFVMGTGVARYIQGASSLNYDAVYNGINELETLQMRGSNIAYQHFWSEHAHTSLTAGWLSVEDNMNLNGGDYKSGYYGSANFFWQAVKNLTFGAEVLVGERLNVNQAKGTATRIQMNATYTFNKNLN